MGFSCRTSSWRIQCQPELAIAKTDVQVGARRAYEIAYHGGYVARTDDVVWAECGHQARSLGGQSRVPVPGLTPHEANEHSTREEGEGKKGEGRGECHTGTMNERNGMLKK